MKRTKIIFPFLILALVMTGCQGNEKEHKQVKEKSEKVEQVQKETYPSKEKTITVSSTGEKMVKAPEDTLVLVNKDRHLASDFVPSDLVTPNIPFSFEENLPKKLMRKEAAAHVEQLFAKAKEMNINILGVSGFRAYDTQKAIYTGNVARMGESEASFVSAKPGQSEHQTGLALDVSSPSVKNDLVESFGDTTEGQWLAKYAPDYGFIIRYPKSKEQITGYQYEPWHIRYVGQKAAKEITKKGIVLEEYYQK